MPDLDDNKMEGLDPSSDLELDAQQPVEHPNEVSDDANSSTATGEDDASLLSVVRNVVGQEDEEGDPTASPAEGEEEKENDDTALAEEDDENYSDVPFHKHPRFQQLLRKSKAYEQDAQRYQNVQTFIDQHGLSAEEAADGLVIMSLMKTNPAEAWKRLRPTVQNLLIAAGEVIPQDLQAKVQKGEMSQQAALEVSRARAQVQSQQAYQSFEQQRTQRQQAVSATQALVGAADAWEAERRRKDPNFDAKQEPLMKEVLFIQQKEGKATTAEGVRDQLNRAYKAVTLSAPKKAAPAQRTAPRTNMSGQVAGNQRPARKSTLDIINSVVANAG